MKFRILEEELVAWMGEQVPNRTFEIEEPDSGDESFDEAAMLNVLATMVIALMDLPLTEDEDPRLPTVYVIDEHLNIYAVIVYPSVMSSEDVLSNVVQVRRHQGFTHEYFDGDSITHVVLPLRLDQGSG